MTIIKKYQCGICKTSPDQISHHKSHLETEKHKDKFELFKLKLSKLSQDKLIEKYKTTNIKDICNELENIINFETKIKNDEVYDIDIQLIMTENEIVSNKEALKDKIHEIHNFLRNNGAGYGMNALKVFNIIFGLKKIEDIDLFDKIDLDPVCKFSNLLRMANLNNNKTDEQLTSFIFNEVLNAICNSNIKDLLFYEIPRGINAKAFRYLIQEIDSITKIENECNVLLSGKIYEYFIGRDETAISELGAYFTDRHIVDYIFKKLDPKIREDGSVHSMIDMFGGSGGFTTGYIDYLIKKYPNINWKKEINKIHHYDMNEDVIKSAGLELFCLTGELPNMDNIKYKNSFTDEFNNKKYMYPITNPPYGGDKNKKTIAQEKSEKVKEYIKKELKTTTDEGLIIKRQKQLKTIEAKEKQNKKDSDKSKVCVANCSGRIQKFAKVSNLNGNDKETCSLMLLMDIVKVGGTAIGVLKEGVFFNRTYKELRKYLIENYNVREVISVPQDQFENTSTKTSILIFDNTENKTENVIFSDLIVERYDTDSFTEINDVIVINEFKGDISGISDKVVSVATKEEILNNPIYSLNAKDYNKKVIVCGKGYELVELGSVCNIMCGNNLPKNKSISGNYNVYGGGETSYTHNEYNLEGFNILISRVGNNNIKLVNEKFYLTDNGFSLLINDIEIKKYIGYYLLNNEDIILNVSNGSAQKVISKTALSKLKIPIPKSEDKITEWVDKISKPYDEKNNKQNKIKELETYIQNKIKDIEENEECDEVEFGSVCSINDKNIERFNTSYNDNNGKYKFHTGCANGNYYCNDYNIDKYTIIFNKTNGSGKCNIFLDKYISCAKQTYICQSLHKEKETQYIYYYLQDKIDELEIGYIGSGHKNLSFDFLQKFQIKIPKNKKFIEDLEPTFQEIEKLNEELKDAEILYKILIKELAEEAIPSTATLTEENLNIKNDSKTPSVKSSVSSSSSIKEFKEQCKSLGIKEYSKCKKAELIKLLEDHK